MGDNLYLVLRYNSTPDELKPLTQKSNWEHKQFVCALFAQNNINKGYVQSVNLLDKPFQPYSAYIEFDVTLRGSTSAPQLWRIILQSWSSMSNIWLSPKQHYVISEHEFEPPTATDLVLNFFSFGTILDGYKYVRCTDMFSKQYAPKESHLPVASGDYDDDYYDDLFDFIEDPGDTLMDMLLEENIDIGFAQAICANKTGPSVSMFSFNNKTIYIYFNGVDLIERFYCIELSWTRDLEKRIIVVEDNDAGVTRLYFQLHLLPKIFQAESYKRRGYIVNSCNATDYINGEQFFKWNRKCIFPNCKKDVLGNCTAMELVITQTEDKSKIRQMLMYMKRFDMDITYCHMQDLKPTPKTLWGKLYRLTQKNFDVYWALKTLYSRGYLVIETLVREPQFIMYLQANNDRKKLQKALYDTASLVESERYVNILKAFEHFFSSEYKVPMVEYRGLEYMKSVVCTPLRLVFYPPIPVMSNRILREYDPEYFIRVSFRDEDMNKIMFGHKDFFKEVIYDRISQPMPLYDREYSFLACSNSQLRSHGVWFYSTDKTGTTAEYIRSKMGDLSRIQNVASYVSRMGQCFSNTQRGTVQIRPEWLKCIDDVERNGYVFSDGTGMISTALQDEVAETLGHKSRSLYQIRFGGCKGTVALNPRLPGKQLVIRNSMKKFESDHRELEICGEADVSRLFLNHQSIMLMEQLGVPRHVFLRIQEKAVFDLLDMMLYETKSAAMIDHRTIPHIKFRPLVKQGVSLITDPFIRKIILLVLYKTIDSMKNLGHIELPLDYARSLMGTMDTTDTLQYGEVFVQYSTDLQKQGESNKVLTGDVIITKFPAVHKGDMRRFVARDVPALHHMVDCIVFPSQGPRPHPDEMAGSDLDGDDYFVTWLPELLTNFQSENQPPMDYSSKKKVLGRPVTLGDMYTFITDYIQNDNLGKISNALKAYADTEKDGFFSEKCTALAKKHSQAVDFPKTEIPVDLERDEIATIYPDFMGKQGMKWVYNSKRVLGTMYRACRNLIDIIEDSLHNDKGYVKAMEMPKVPLSKNTEDQAVEAYNNYVNGLNEIMHSYGIATEEELVSGKILNLHKRMCERKDMFSTLDIVRTMVMQFRAHFRKLFFRELGYEDEPHPLVINAEMQKKAIAWYNVVYSTEKTQKFLSFAWIVADIIGDIMKTTSSRRQTSIERINESVCDLYNTVNVQQEEPNPQLRDQIRAIVREYPGMVVLWLFLWLWCQYQKIDYDFVRQLLHNFLRKNYNIDIRSMQTDAYTRFDLMKAAVSLDDANSTKITGLSIGEVLLPFLRYLGSQEFVNQKGTFDKDMKALYVHNLAMKAYFHLAVFNDCQELVSKSKADIELKDIDIHIPNHIWIYISGYSDAIKADIKEVFPGIASLSLKRKQRGRYPNGSIFALGFFDEVMALEQVLYEWLYTFTRQPRYGVIFRAIKERIYWGSWA